VATLLTNFIDSAYIRVIESGCGLGLSQLTLPGILIGGDFCGKKLNRYFAAELRILGQVNLAHAAASELLDDTVVRDGFADHLREYYVEETSKSMKAEN
jgi:hypothetical protein